MVLSALGFITWCQNGSVYSKLALSGAWLSRALHAWGIWRPAQGRGSWDSWLPPCREAALAPLQNTQFLGNTAGSGGRALDSSGIHSAKWEMCWHYVMPGSSGSGAAPGGTQARRPCTGRHCAFSSRAQTPSFRVTLSLANSPRQGSGPGSIRLQSGVAGCGAVDPTQLLCPLFISASWMPPVSPSDQLTQGPSPFSPVPGHLFYSCLWSDCWR